MGETVSDVIHDLFPMYVSDIILLHYAKENNATLNKEINTVAPVWLKKYAKKTFRCYTVYVKCGVLAHSISRAMNKVHDVLGYDERWIGGGPTSFYIRTSQPDKYLGAFNRPCSKRSKTFDEHFMFREYRVTKDYLLSYLVGNGFRAKEIKTKTNKELFALTMTF